MLSGVSSFSIAIILTGALQIVATAVSDVAHRWQNATEAWLALVRTSLAGRPASKAPGSSIVVLGSYIVSIASLALVLAEWTAEASECDFPVLFRSGATAHE